MLQEYKLNDIITIKLVSGEEVVGKLTERSIDGVTLAKPVTVGMQQVAANQVGLAFLPVLGSVSPNTSINIPFSGMAIRPIRTGDEVMRNYIKATSDIVTATPEQTRILTA